MYLKVNVENKKRKTPSMYEVVTQAGLIKDTVFESPALIKDKDSRSNAMFATTPDGWFQPYSYNGNIFMEEVPDPNIPPEEPPVPTTDYIVHYVDDVEVDRFYRVIKP